MGTFIYKRQVLNGVTKIGGSGGSIDQLTKEIPESGEIDNQAIYVDNQTKNVIIQNPATEEKIDLIQTVEIKYTDYMNLTEEQRSNDNVIYKITDKNPGDFQSVLIDDENVSDKTTYSSEKINSSLAELAENRSYSTEEHWTGKYWYDGKKIYEKTINGNYATLGSVLANLSILNVSDFVSEKHLIQFDANLTLYYSNGDIVSSSGDSKPPYTYKIENNVLTLAVVTSSLNNNKVKFISLEYTKTTD